MNGLETMIEVKWELDKYGFYYFMFRLGDYKIDSICYTKSNKKKRIRATFIKSRKETYINGPFKEPECVNPLLISPSDLINWIKEAEIHHANNIKEKLIRLLEL